MNTFGKVIHEFDPWFNYRATEYLLQHGADKFFKWFDYMSWYPLGRPVGTTIYPGMQFAAVWIHQFLEYIGQPMSLNDVCVYMPAWFGVVAAAFVGLLTHECSRDVDAGILATFIMAVIPAHIMRSVAGGYDNECVAVPALCATFYFWVRSLRGPNSWPWGAITGLSYFWMVASWGGYTFVLNMIGLHATALVFTGRFSVKLHLSYSLFFVIGTTLGIQVPVVGMTPLRSLEQMGPLGVFFLLQIMAFCEAVRKRTEMPEKEFNAFRQKVFIAAGGAGAIVAAMLFQMGYFGPLSARIRGLFVQHTRTGNPLVDSVAEHQATSPMAYWQYLHYMCYLAPLGFGMTLMKMSDPMTFVTLYAIVAYYFSAKMNRLILLMGPICSVLGGLALSGSLRWALEQLTDLSWLMEIFDEEPEPERPSDAAATKKGAKAKAGSAKAPEKSTAKRLSKKKPAGVFDEIFAPLMEVYEEAVMARRALAGFLFVGVLLYGKGFLTYCHRMGDAMSQPSIMFMSRQSDGRGVIIDDYREAYWWLRDNTPEDARVMAWWDYGYQIAGVANRTTIADGNTWNHEHIATLGKCLTSPEKKAHSIARHLADYVLVWTGGGGDDLAKSPHMARIANSVYPDLCPNDPTCSSYGMDHNTGTPTPMMASSLLYKLHSHNQKNGVKVSPKMFKEAYTSKNNLVRIFKVLNISEESKAYAADPANRLCDAPGSWYCNGQYPPALRALVEKRKNFKQLEDFNAGKDEDAEEYQKAYHARMSAER